MFLMELLDIVQNELFELETKYFTGALYKGLVINQRKNKETMHVFLYIYGL